MRFDTFFYNLTFATGFPNKQTAYKYRVETNRILCHDDIISRQESVDDMGYSLYFENAHQNRACAGGCAHAALKIKQQELSGQFLLFL